MKHWEFWHPRVFETPYYLYLLAGTLLRGMAPRDLLKANYALDHGELGVGSKYTTQMAFAQDKFPATTLVSMPDTQALRTFAEAHDYPILIKPRIGVVGKGVHRLDNVADVESTKNLTGDYLVQAFVPHSHEYGVFFTRIAGVNRISGINQKHFPTVIGNGRDNLAELAQAHPRYTDHWSLFMRYLDLTRVPVKDETVRLSFIGSHTMGCKFTNDFELLTPELEAAVFEVCDSQPGFNFGRLDVKAADQAAFQAGDFVVIEINGVSSLPTHMFDPDQSLLTAHCYVGY